MAALEDAQMHAERTLLPGNEVTIAAASSIDPIPLNNILGS
jgi:hypothetical protein